MTSLIKYNYEPNTIRNLIRLVLTLLTHFLILNLDCFYFKKRHTQHARKIHTRRGYFGNVGEEEKEKHQKKRLNKFDIRRIFSNIISYGKGLHFINKIQAFLLLFFAGRGVASVNLCFLDDNR